MTSELANKISDIVSVTTEILKEDGVKMSSREIAEITGKRHDNVLRDINKLNDYYSSEGLLIIEERSYTLENTGKQEHKEFLLSKEQTLDLITGYSTPLRVSINRRWLELEKREKRIPNGYSEALRMLADETDAHEATKAVLNETVVLLEEAEPKVSYYDIVLACPDLLTVGDIAADYGISAIKLNKILNECEIQYKPKGSDMWVLYVNYAQQGLAQTQSYLITNPKTGETSTKLHLKWTQKGRLFIYETLKKKGILPICERT